MAATLWLSIALVMASISIPAMAHADCPRFGLMMDVGLPSGASGSAVLRPVHALRLHARLHRLPGPLRNPDTRTLTCSTMALLTAALCTGCSLLEVDAEIVAASSTRHDLEIEAAPAATL